VSPPLSRWRQVIAVPGVSTLLVGAVLGRLAYGVMPVAVFLSLLHTSRSVREAAVLTAVQGLVGAVAFPWKGRLVDRRGRSARWWMAALCLLSGVGCLAARTTGPLFGLLVALAATSPPVTSTVRAAWGARIPVALRNTAFAVDAALEEAAFLIGPALGGVGVAVCGGRVTAMLSTVLLLAAVALLAVLQAPAGEQTVIAGRRGKLGPATRLIAGLLTTAAFAQGLVGATLAVAASGTGIYGLLLSLEGVGSFIGLALLGAVALPAARKVMLLAVATPLLVLPLLLAHGVLALAITVTVLGLPAGSLVAALNARVTNLEDQDRWNEAFAVLVTCQNLASAAGFALGGALASPLGQNGPALAGLIVLTTGFGLLLPKYSRTAGATQRR
jgi:predicted MFS family arabinose efflux permease